MKSDIFISYSRNDLAEVEPFVKQIEARTGLRCWIDWNGIESGAEFEEKIVSAIDEVKVVLFFVSDHSMASPYAKMEINYAYNTQKKVVPVVLDGGQLRGWFLFKFGSINFIDCKEPRQVDTLMGNLKAWCGGKPVPAPAPAPIPAPTPTPTPAPTPVKTYQVGDFYDDGTKQGVVFEVDASGRNGKIVSLTEHRLNWSLRAVFEKGIKVGATDMHNGQNNQAVVQKIADWRTNYPAFAWCADQGEGWYLPALQEVKRFALDDAVHTKVNQTLQANMFEKLHDKGEGHRYWSSTELVGQTAWLIDMRNAVAGSPNKDLLFYVRAVASFGEKAPVKERVVTDTESVKTYQVGDYYDDGTKQGVVFEVDASGRHGKIVSLRQSEQQWCSETEYHKGIKTGATDQANGMTNQRKIEQINNWRNKYPAFAWCADLGEGWYLPAIEESKKILLDDSVHDKVNRTLQELKAPKLFARGEVGWYWSSTEDAKICAWFVGMLSGGTYGNVKLSLNSVRAVSAF